jgi:hypothetical protein
MAFFCAMDVHRCPFNTKEAHMPCTHDSIVRIDM